LCAMITSEAPRLRLATTQGVPSQLTEIVERCLAKDRRERFASAAELEIELRAIVIGEGTGRVSLRPSTARTISDDTLEPQDTSSRGVARASTAPPTKLASRRRNAALAVTLAAALGGAVWWARLPSELPYLNPASGGTVNSATATAASVPVVELAASGVTPPENPDPEPPTRQQSVTAVGSLSGSTSVRTAAAPLAGRLPGSSAAAATASGSPSALDETAVLKDRR